MRGMNTHGAPVGRAAPPPEAPAKTMSLPGALVEDEPTPPAPVQPSVIMRLFSLPRRLADTLRRR